MLRDKLKNMLPVLPPDLNIYKRDTKCKVLRRASIFAPFLTTCSTCFLIFMFLATPARCNSDDDCLKGKANCYQRECHCVNHLHYGDGKEYCFRKYKSFCNKVVGDVLKSLAVTTSLRYACLCFPVMTARESISPDLTLSLYDT